MNALKFRTLMADIKCLRSNYQILNTGGIPPKCMPGIWVSVVCDKIIKKNSMCNK